MQWNISNTENKTPKIIAPVCSIESIAPLFEAGADEIYFGVMPKEWTRNYGMGDLLTRRQSKYAHFSSISSMGEIVQTANQYKRKATLILNSRYSNAQLPFVYQQIENWEKAGGHSLMVADMELLQWLDKHKSRLERHLSIMAGVFNSQSVAFYKNMNVSRIVLPRELTLDEIAKLSEEWGNEIDFEVIAMFQKCEFIDAYCNFYHAVNYRPYIVKNNLYTANSEKLPIISTCDCVFEGHGCQLPFRCGNDKFKHLINNDMETPFCAACFLDYFLSHGVRCFKIAGRGYPDELILKAITFIRQTIESKYYNQDKIRDDYSQLFSHDCKPEKCYYFVSKANDIVNGSCNSSSTGHPKILPADFLKTETEKISDIQYIEQSLFLTLRESVNEKILENIQNKQINRIYFGHETCERLLPDWDEFKKLYDITRQQNIKLTFVCPFLSNSRIKEIISLLEKIAANDIEAEVVSSDWGLLSQLVKNRIGTPVVSRFLIGQQLDFRIKYIENQYENRIIKIENQYYNLKHQSPTLQTRDHLAQCTLLKPFTLEFLKYLGISRLELNNVYQDIQLPENDYFHYSLHVPFSPMTVFRNCPENMDFGYAQQPCMRTKCYGQNSLLQTAEFPNSILICKDNALYYSNSDYIEHLKKNSSIDRIVLHNVYDNRS